MKTPPRPRRDWEVIAFRVSIETRKQVETMRAAMGCSLGEFMRFLVRQELKGFRIPASKWILQPSASPPASPSAQIGLP